MSTRNSPPLEAVLLPDAKPRKSWVPWIMGSILVGSFLLAIVAAAWGLIKLVESIDRPQSFAGGEGSGDWQLLGEKQAEFRAAFKVPVELPPDADVRQVEKFLTRYVTAARYNDVGGLSRLVDVNAFLKLMLDHPDMPRLDATGRKALLEELNEKLQLPSDVTEFRLMGFKRLAKGGLGVADVILKRTRGNSEPCRIWLQQNERAWSAVDWEIVQQGKSQAGQWAGAQRAAQDYLAAMYDSSVDDLEQADDCYSRGDIPGAISLVQSADQRTLPGYVHKEMQLGVARRYYLYGQFQSAIDCLHTIIDTDRDEVPGVYVIHALCYQALGNGKEAIAAAARYEQLCGFSPDVVRAKAQALVQLEKKGEAIAELKRLLEFDPSDHAALQQLVRVLPAGQKGEIADLIGRTKDPPASALAVAHSFLVLEDQETTQAIKNLLEKKYAGSPATHAFIARVHQHEEEFDQAAAAFRRAHAAETDAKEKQDRWHEYVSAMHSAGKLVQAYDESPNPLEMFEYLTDGLDAGESVVEMKDLSPLLEAHRRRAPQDPRLFYCTGLFAQHQEDLVAAEEALAAGEAKATDETLKEELQYARLEILAGQGRILDAYRDYEQREDVFRTLAERCRQQHKPDVLEELIRVRRSAQPKDPELAFYEIALLIQRNKLQQAWQSLQNSELWDGDLAERMIELEVDIYTKFDQWELAMRQFPPHPVVLPALAKRLANQQAWGKLGALLEMNVYRSAKDTHLRLHQIQVAWHLRNYQTIEELVPGWQPSEWTGVPSHEQRWARETLVRSLLRLGKTSLALEFAQQFQREFREEFPLLLVQLALGDPSGVKESLASERYRVHNIAQDAELLPLLTDSRFAEIRRAAPLELPSGSPRTALLAFLRQPLDLDETKLRSLLPQELQFQIKQLPSRGETRQTLALTHPEGIIFLTFGKSPYPLAPEDWDLIRSGPYPSGGRALPAGSELKAHQGWLAIELLDTAAALTGPHKDRLAKTLVQKLCDDNLLAIALDDPATPTLFVPKNLLRPESLTPERSWKEWLSDGTSLWLSLGTNFESDEQPSPGRKAQREFAADIAKLPAGQFAQVRVELTLGHATEEVWLKVVSLDRYEYGGYHLTCELPTDSQLYHPWKAGERCNVSFWQVRETKLPEGK